MRTILLSILMLSLGFFSISLQSCSKNKGLRVIETEDAVIQYPSNLSLINDSMLLIDDQSISFSLNTNTGELKKLDEDEKYIEKCYAAIASYNYFGGKILQREQDFSIVYPRFSCIDKNCASVRLVSVSVCIKEDSFSSAVRQAVFVTGPNGDKLLVEKNDSTVMPYLKLAFGNAYISDTLVIMPRVAYFTKNTPPDTLPLLSVFSIDNDGDLSYKKDLYFKNVPAYNTCTCDDKSDECHSVSSFSFHTANGKIYLSNGVDIYEYRNGEVSKLASPAQNSITAFRFDGDTIYTIEEDTAKVYTANAYSLSTQKPIDCRYSIPAGLDIRTIDFIGENLHVLHFEGENFYLLTIK